MTGKSTYLNVKDFANKSTLKKSQSECLWGGVSFRKGDTMENHRIKEILAICQKYHSFNINTLIVKSQNDLTIWIEEKNLNNQVGSLNSESKNPQNSQEDRQKLPTKTVTKKYRGQVYEETVIDWSAVKNINSGERPRRKYRGQYID